MKLPRRNFLHLAAGAAALPALSWFARGQAYPTRPVRIIVGATAGGGFPEPMRKHVRSWRKRTSHRHRDVCGRVAHSRAGRALQRAAEQVVKSFRYLLTDPRQFDILQSGPR
jgi:hypothetical protein